MEEIIAFKHSILEETFPSFFDEFKNKKVLFQLEFINGLKRINLDLFFFITLKRHHVVENLDDKVIKPLKQEFLLEKGRDGFYKNQFYKIIEKAPFKILLLKGWQLRERMNHELYKRSCDVDILVLEEEYINAIKFLEKEFDFFSKPQYIAYGQNCMLNENSMCIDLHKTLIATQALDSILHLSATELFKEAFSKNIKNSTYWEFNLEMEFIHLCIHFLLHHEGFGFLLVYELKVFLNENIFEINQEKLIKIAIRHKVTPIVIFSLMTLKKLCYLPEKEIVWVNEFIDKYDKNNIVATIFSNTFSTSNYYKNIGISKRIIKDLLVNNNKDKVAYLKGAVQFKIDSFIKYLNQNLRRA